MKLPGLARHRPAIALGTALAGATASLLAAGLTFLGVRRGVPILASSVSDMVVGLTFPLAGAVIVQRRPDNAAGWVLVSAAFIGASSLAHVWVHQIVSGGANLPGLAPAAWVASWAFTPYFLQPVLLPLLFPHGRLPGGLWRPVVRIHLAMVALATLAAAFRSDPDTEGLGVANPLGLVPEPWSVLNVAVMMTTAIGSFFVLGPAALVWFFLRLRRSRGVERAQRQWLLLGFTAAFAGLLAQAAGPALGAVAWSVGFSAIPACILIAVVRHQLLDIEMAVNRTVAFALLTAIGVVAYFGLVALVGALAGGSRLAPFVAAGVAVGAASVRTRVQDLVERRLFGAASDPYLVMDRVGADVAAALEPLEALVRLTESVRGQLNAPFVAVEPTDGEVPAAVSGTPSEDREELPLVSGGRRVGTLSVGRRSGEALRPKERAVLRDVARRAGALLDAAALTRDLRRSRDELVIAREEERRRVRRDLHDGLGPALAGMALQIDGLTDRLGQDPDAAARAQQLRTRVTEAVREVRRIIDGLRPAMVDELGLLEALRQLGVDDQPGLRIDIDGPERLPELPAAVESAPYRIVAEALANAIRHAGARQCTVTIGCDAGYLEIEVSDDGRGFGADVATGVGLRSIHDRAEEVGGLTRVNSEPGRGTTVSTRLPLAVMRTR